MSSLQTAIIILLAAVLIGYLMNRKPADTTKMFDKELSDNYDYIVVGGGSAGSVVAARLSEDKRYRVLLLEAGGHYDENEAIHVPIMWAALEQTKQDWQYYTEPQKQSFQGLNGNRGFFPRGKVLGGSSCINAMQYTRGSPFDYAEWEAAGCDGWGYKDVLKYFLKAENVDIDEFDSSSYHSKGGPITNSFSYRTELKDIYLKAGKELGYPITDYNGEDQHGFSTTQKSIRNAVRSSTGLEYIGKAEYKDNLHVSLNSFATKIDIMDKRAVGVYFIKDGRKHYVKCNKEIIVSGGAINSPQLLMLSGVGPKDHLNQLGIPVHADLPVGKNLQDHQLIFLKTKINKPLSINPVILGSLWNQFRYKFFKTGPYAASGLEGSAFLHLDKTKVGKTYPDIQMIFLSILFRDNILNVKPELVEEFFESDDNAHGFTVAVCTTRPKSAGSITLHSADPFDYPKIDPAYYTDERDMDTILGGIRLYEQLMETKAFKELGVNLDGNKYSCCSDYEFRSDDYWKCLIRHLSTTEYHHSGTCRMGARDNPTAVVDPQLRVIGINGLRVADASIFPNVTSGNTNIPVIMVGEKVADMIRKGK
ncbi:hypothetical protein ACF0H5_009660 [Mactra antiquata]